MKHLIRFGSILALGFSCAACGVPPPIPEAPAKIPVSEPVPEAPAPVIPEPPREAPVPPPVAPESVPEAPAPVIPEPPPEAPALPPVAPEPLPGIAPAPAAPELAPEIPVPAPPSPPAAPKPPIVQEGIRIYPAEGFLEVDARTCLETGIIELYASSPGGKLHESLLVILARPQFIHFGLIILGLKEGKGCDVQGGAQAPRGEPVDLFVEWEEEGKPWRAKAEDLIYNVHTKKRMEQGAWVFTGSRFVKDRNPNTGQERDIYLANATGTVITTFRDPSSILDNASEFSADDTSYVVNEALAPPAGTSVRLLIMPKGKGPAARRELVVPALSETDAGRVPALLEAALGQDPAAAAGALKSLAALGRPVLAEVRGRVEAAPDDAARAALQKLFMDLKGAMHAPPQPPTEPVKESKP